MTKNAELAGAALGSLDSVGVRDFIVCAGARNAPLVTTLLSHAASRDWRVRHHFDERTASFFALGIAKRTVLPVAVFTTSGTAAAELLPAAIEAHYSGVPLVLVTADRPIRFRGSGAPQAIEQAALLAPYALCFDIENPAQLADMSGWQRDGPLHLNLC
ncbi:MAG: thiamine pyrophosphate-binding protein, partial [Planctomycetota bacterium]